MAFGFYAKLNSKIKARRDEANFVIAAAKICLKYGTELPLNFNAINNLGDTPLHIMFNKRPHEDVENFIKVAKDDFNIEFDLTVKNKDGLTPSEVPFEKPRLIDSDFIPTNSPGPASP